MEILKDIGAWLSTNTGAISSIGVIFGMVAILIGRSRNKNIYNLTFNFGRKEVDESLKGRESEIRSEIRAEYNSKEEKSEEERKLLLEELTGLKQKQANLEKTLEEKKAIITDTWQKLKKYQGFLPKEQLTSAKEALEKGDTSQAEILFKEVKETQAGYAAEAAYQLAKLAEDRIDYATARENYIQAAQFEPDNTVYLNATGLIMHTLGQYDKAIEYYDKALESNLKTFDDDHPNVAACWNNLGSALDSKGEHDKAIGYFEKALESNLKSPDHPNVAIDWNNLGSAWNAKGEYDKAIEYYDKALESNLKTLSPGHPDVATNWNNLGTAWNAKDGYDKAIWYFEKALANVLKAFGPEHPHVAASWNNLGGAWNAKGEYNKAIEYYEKALKSDSKTFGNDHPNIATCWNNLGWAWQDKGEYGKAIGYFEKALKVFRKAELEHRVKDTEESLRIAKKAKEESQS